MITAVLSTGRCGTQWLTQTLSELHADEVVAEHEPIGARYSPRRFFRRHADPEAILEVPEVREHIERIASLEEPYVETGWPLFAALPLLARLFPDRLRVLHLTRHPVPSALSHLAHSSFAGSDRDDDYTRLATLGPTDANVFQDDYEHRWDGLTPYEKCLYWITEVGAFGLEFEERYPQIPFLRIKSENMLGGNALTLAALVDFLRVKPDMRWLERTSRRVDRWHHHTDRELDPLAIRRHAFALATARRLDYSPLAIDPTALRSRYAGAPHEGAAT